jgi:GNAT superfamily N-acetyltransferase
MTNVLNVRVATADDVPDIMRFIRELAEYEHLSHEVVATEDDLRRELFCEDPVPRALIGEIDGKAAGFALYFLNFSTFLGKPGIYLEDLFVRKAARGCGLGRALLRRLARIAADAGYGRVEWSVLDWNEPAIEFYKQLGAVPMDEWTVFRLTGDSLKEFAGDGQ